MTWDNLPGGDLWELEWAKHYFISCDNIYLVIEIYGWQDFQHSRKELEWVAALAGGGGGRVVVTGSFS